MAVPRRAVVVVMQLHAFGRILAWRGPVGQGPSAAVPTPAMRPLAMPIPPWSAVRHLSAHAGDNGGDDGGDGDEPLPWEDDVRIVVDDMATFRSRPGQKAPRPSAAGGLDLDLSDFGGVDFDGGRPRAAPAPARLRVEVGRCVGCGVPLQSSAPGSPGYVPAAKLEEATQVAHTVICARCHSLRHRNAAEDALRVNASSVHESLRPARFDALLRRVISGSGTPLGSGAVSRCGCVVYLVDLFDVHGSILTPLDRATRDMPVIVVGTKVDLLPSDTSLRRVEVWLRGALREALPSLKPAEVHLVSATSGAGVDALHGAMLRWARRVREKGDVYVVGAANVGKSSLLNCLLRTRGHASLGGPAARPALTASHLPGTTLGVMPLRCADGLLVMDTPGVVQPSQLSARLAPSDVDALLPKRRLKPVALAMGPGKALLFGAVAVVEVVDAPGARGARLVAFVAEGVTTHPTKMERANELRTTRAGGLLRPPSSAARVEALGDLVPTHVDVEGQGWDRAAVDVVVSGLGWVAVATAGRVALRVHVPEGVAVTVRPPLLPYLGTQTAKFTGARVVRPPAKAARRKRRR